MTARSLNAIVELIENAHQALRARGKALLENAAIQKYSCEEASYSLPGNGRRWIHRL
jgi:hypothetical protein